MRLERSGPWIGWGGVVCLLWLCGASVLFAPWWVVALMLLVWLCCAVLVLGWSGTRPVRTAYVPLVGILLWFLVAVLTAR